MKVNYSETFLKRSTFLLALSFCKIGQMRSETTKKKSSQRLLHNNDVKEKQ